MPVDFEIKDNYDFEDLLAVITALRAPDGCPWDRVQTHQSLKNSFIEEIYEVIEAINKGSSQGLREELGDVLLQITLHCEIERELGKFTMSDVIDDLVKKLVVRHPHVFGDVVANNSEEALDSWDSAKQKSKGTKTQSESMLSVARELPALMRAQKIQRKAARVGFDWEDVDGALDKLYEEIDELKKAISHNNQKEIDEEFGDMLFSCVNISRFIKVDSEDSLTSATDKFINRFTIVEQLAQERNIDMKTATLDVLDDLWDEAKKITNA